ncbi:carboxylesterase/lipase family protein [Solibacillus sp. CAU 1738]|uniref:carboxylesterase/lipase family protein n=1 Tax=Solibacillus sp. CAU 1738 TaxID=3140363 RepID=UPI0032611576
MSTTIVRTRYGKVAGKREGKVSVWKGIPYAAPPINHLRFCPPMQLESWDGVREAKSFGPAAMQSEREIMKFMGDAPTNISEDCLYLNVWSPGADTKQRPVMVWIHGGSFLSGSGSSSLYDGTSFAEQGDVVVVTINYRLGVFGFLHLAEMDGEKYATSGNCGLLDQVAALKWVNENIEAFGGDPNKVTIFGESAGAISVGSLLTMPSAKGLFNQAILQSGSPSHLLNSEVATKAAEILLSELQIGKEELSKLESIPAEVLLKAAEDIPWMSLGPVIDGISIPQQPEKALSEGFAKDISILIGTTLDEWRLFTFFNPMWKQINENELVKVFEQSLGPLWPEISRYLLDEGELNQALYEHMMTYNVFTFPAIHLSEIQIMQGTPVWMYRFDYQSTALDGVLKACHGLEIPFVWKSITKSETENLTGDAPERFKLANQMHRAWIAFAHTGNPNTLEVPDWPSYDLENRATMLFNVENEIVNDPDSEKRLIWKNATEKLKVN